MGLDNWLLGFSFSQPIPRQFLSNLKKYRYNSQDNSLLSKYVLCHYWNGLVKLFPLTIAPNMITLMGLLTIVLSSILCVYFASSLEGPLPAWLYYLIGFSVWAYASLDAIDGKQARRTGQCGPLGELFDHGCDALNLSLMNLIFPLIYGIKISWIFMAAVFFLFFGFYVVTWDEYHTNTLYLTVISGPVEGTIIFTISAIITGYYGLAAWEIPVSQVVPFLAKTPIGILKCKDVIPTSLIVAGVMTVSCSLWRVLKINKRAPLQLVPFISFAVSAFVCLFMEDALWSRITEVLLYLGFTFCHATASLILAHLSLTEPALYEPAYMPSVLGSIFLTARLLGIIQFTEQHALLFLRLALMYVIGTYLIRAYVTVNQISGYLDIYCLSIKKKGIKKQ